MCRDRWRANWSKLWSRVRDAFHPLIPIKFSAAQFDVIKWKHFPRYWPFVRGIHRSPVNSPHKGQWRRAVMFSLICAWINDWVNSCEAGDLRRHRVHYDATVMKSTNHTLDPHRRPVPSKHRTTFACPLIVLTILLSGGDNWNLCRCWQTPVIILAITC